MAEVNLIELVDDYDSLVKESPEKVESTFSKKQMSHLLRELRKAQGYRRPDIVLAFGPKLLSYESNLEVWNVHEQIAVAALDIGQISLAESHISILKKQFPESLRVGRLEGMLLESKGKFADALLLYDELLKKDITNIAIMKRKACVTKATKDSKAQIEALNGILHNYPGDGSSWMELAEIYITDCNYSSAAHCLEELVLLDPRNAHFHCKLADVVYSLSAEDCSRFLQARKHYSISLTHQQPSLNLRALLGVISACQRIEELPVNAFPELDDQEKRVNSALLQWATEQLQAIADNRANVAVVAKAIC